MAAEGIPKDGEGATAVLLDLRDERAGLRVGGFDEQLVRRQPA
jgi:hypothetical protein